MSRLSNPARVALWSDRLIRLQQSGMTVAQFCKQEALNVGTLYYWKRKLRTADASSRTPPTPKFLAVHVVPAPQAQQAILRLPAGLSMELPLSLSREAVTSVLTACIEAAASADHLLQRRQ